MQQVQQVMDRVIGFNRAFETMSSRILKIQQNKLISISKIDGTDKQIFHALSEEVETIAEAPRLSHAKSFREIMDAKKKAQEENSFSEDALAPEINLTSEATEFETTTIDSTELIEAEAKVRAKGHQESFSLSVTLNEKQLAAKEMAFQGKSFCLIGAAGTGKTTTQRAVAESLLLDDRLSVSRFKSYTVEGARQYLAAPSIAFVAYTRRAASNLAKAILKSPVLAEKLKNNIMTIHGLLEYEPETYFDADEQKEKFRFAPTRTAANPLDITHLVIEEASMLGVSDLWPKLYDALPSGVQIIFIGDINQLPPVFGPSILNYALVQLPIIELTEVYRNQGVVLENAHNILAGNDLVESEQYKIIRGSSKVQEGQAKTADKLAHLFKIMYDSYDEEGNRLYDPEDCVVLSPFNKMGNGNSDQSGFHLGSNSVNKWIAQFLGADRKAIVHEVIAGFSKQYLAEGDKVMFNKVDGVITKIERNRLYFGKEPQTAGEDLSRFGHRILNASSTHDPFEDGIDYANFSLDVLEEEKLERKQQASHVVTITYADGRYDNIGSAGDLAETVFSLGYCLSVHKAQGSEWRKVFIIFHKDHATMLYRELFYTAATRARTDVCIIAKDPVIARAIKNQRIKGKTLKDKLEFFNSGQLKYADIMCIK